MCAAHGSDFLRLSRLLRHASDAAFQFVIAEFDGADYRDALIKRLGDEPPAATVWRPAPELDPQRLPARLQELAQHHRAIHVLDFLAYDRAREHAASIALNHARERLARKAPATLIFWVPALGARDFARYAPDLWAWREAVLEFLPAAVPPTSRETELRFDASREQRLARLRQIGDHLAGRVPDDLADARLLLESARVRESLGRLAEALNAAETAADIFDRRGDQHGVAEATVVQADILRTYGEVDQARERLEKKALPVFEQLGDVRSAAITRGQIADLLQARGELDEALRIRRDEQLPVYEQLGDVREAAVTRGQIADVLQVRGELDEALRIRREEQLPVYEQLGDVREAAVTRGKIADVLQARGELDEALRIRREEQLPVYEQLGDVREAAITRGKIADVLQARGELDEALRIRREEELPVYEQLGDVRGQSAALNAMFDIYWRQEKHQEAIDAIARAFQMVQGLGIPDGVSAVGIKLGQILIAAGDAENGCRVLRMSRDAFGILGNQGGAAAVDQLLAEHCAGRPEGDPGR